MVPDREAYLGYVSRLHVVYYSCFFIFVRFKSFVRLAEVFEAASPAVVVTALFFVQQVFLLLHLLEHVFTWFAPSGLHHHAHITKFL